VSDQPRAAWRSFKAALRFIIAVFLTIARFRMLSILPAFDRFLKEAAILGRILAGYGELEYDLATAMGSALNDDDLAFRLLFRNRGEEQRISIGDIILRPICEKWKLVESWERTRRAFSWCKTTRNQYAHCHWFDGEGDGLFFYNIEKSSQSASGPIAHQLFHVDVPLLERQENHFRYVSDGSGYLINELRRRAGTLKSHGWKAPEEIQPPPRHNPQEKHWPRSLGTGDESPPRQPPREGQPG
jgi:hypothetical protein